MSTSDVTMDLHIDPTRFDQNPLFSSDELMPVQWFDANRTRELTPERSLLMAVLEDAVELWTKYHLPLAPCVDLRRAAHRAKWAEANAWLFSDKRDSYLTCPYICDNLDLDLDILRAGLRAWERNPNRSQIKVRRPVSRPPEMKATGYLGEPEGSIA
jgi:hypothetical protein